MSALRESRHKTAMRRSALSRPMSSAIRDRVLKSEFSMFDYGCGFGSDVELLKSSGYSANGWDPFYAANNERYQADIVNLGFVLNVIEDPDERTGVLKDAFGLANRALIVSVRIDGAIFDERFGDGAVTRDGAFQKIYTQAEFRAYIESELKKKIYIIEPGIGYVFKTEEAELEFGSNRYLGRLSLHEGKILKQIHDTVDPHKIARLIEDLGRIPEQDELEELSFLGKRKFRDFIETAVAPIIDKQKFEQSRIRLEEDILQAIAMTRVENRAFVPMRQFSEEFQKTIKLLFGDYREACHKAEAMLFSLGKDGEVAKVGRAAGVGKLLPEDLYIHRSALEYIPGLLKLMLSLGESIAGKINSDLIKFSLHGRSLSFLFYPEFDSNPHPPLVGSVRVDFRTGKLQVRDYSKSENPPILHRKECFVLPSYDRYDEYKALTDSEEAAGLLGQPSIGFQKQWSELVLKAGYEIIGHSLRRLPPTL